MSKFRLGGKSRTLLYSFYAVIENIKSTIVCGKQEFIKILYNNFVIW